MGVCVLYMSERVSVASSLMHFICLEQFPKEEEEEEEEDTFAKDILTRSKIFI